jgi:hypothetical protein
VQLEAVSKPLLEPVPAPLAGFGGGLLTQRCFGVPPAVLGDEAPRVGFEILQILSPDEIIVWANADLTREEFDAIELPPGWFKNQPREVDPVGGSFARSPDASADGEFTEQEHFGHVWLHNATVVGDRRRSE